MAFSLAVLGGADPNRNLNPKNRPSPTSATLKRIELAYVLELAELHGGNWHAFEVREGHSTSDYNRGKLGMIAYGIIDRDAILTNFGRELLALKDDGPALYRRLAKHILLNLHGMTLVRCIQDMVATGEIVSLTTLREGLAARGVALSIWRKASKHDAPLACQGWCVRRKSLAGRSAPH